MADEIPSPGILLDHALRRTSAMDLLDYLMGSRTSYDTGRAELFFSDQIPEEKLRELATTIQSAEISVHLEETSQEGARWVLRIASAKAFGPEPASMAGTIGTTATLTGDVAVG